MDPTTTQAIKKITSEITVKSLKSLSSKLFDKDIENILVNKTDFEFIIDQKILLEEFPQIEVKLLVQFLKSDDVELIVQRIYSPGFYRNSIEEIRDGFCLLFSLHFDVEINLCISFASNLFDILIEGCNTTLNQAISQGLISAHDAKTQFRFNVIEDKLDEIYIKVNELLETNSKTEICKFVFWTDYFSKNEKDLIQSSFRTPTFDTYVDSVHHFICSPRHKVMLIHSPGGYGKSHLLREIAFTISNIENDRKVLIITPGFPDISESIKDEIDANTKYLLVFDDADRYLDELKPLLSYISFINTDIKVILSARTSGLQGINEIINQLPCKNSHEELEIDNWKIDDLIKLLRFVSGKKQVENEEIIVNTYLNPYLIVWIGKQIKQDPAIEFDQIKDNYLNEINYEAERCLNKVLEISIIKKLLFNLSLIVPFSQKDKIVLQTLSELCSEDVDTITHALDLLTKIGMLRIVGNSFRFNPDMKGDLYLAYNLKQTNDEFTLKELIGKWIFGSAEKVLVNVSAASKYEKSYSLHNYCSSLVSNWIENADYELGYYRKEKLELLEKIVHIIPNEALDLMYVYLDTQLPETEQSWLNDLSPTTDDYSPIIIRLLKSGYSRERILELISEINDKVELSTYDNYKPSQLINSSISPVENDFTLICSTLDILQRWVIESNKALINDISLALSELLAGTHIVSHYGFGKSYWRNVTLKSNPDLIMARRKAIDIIKIMLCHHNLNIRLSAIEIISNIGISHSISEDELPLEFEIIYEREVLIKELGKYISIDEDFRVLNKIENLFLEWWAQNKNGTNEVVNLLKTIPVNIEYIVFKYFNSVNFVIEDFCSLENKAPTVKKWEWFVHNYMYNSFELKSEYFKYLATSLNNKYNTDTKIIDYLKELHQIVEVNSVGSLIIDCWIRINSDTFVSIRNDILLWEETPAEFQNVIDLAIANQNNDFILKIYDEVISNLLSVSLEKVETLLKIIGINNVEIKFLDSCINQLIENGNSAIRKLVMHYLFFIYSPKNDFNSIVSYLKLTIKKETNIDGIFIRNMFSQVHNIEKHEEMIDINLLSSFKKDLCESLKTLPELDWYAKELLDYSLNDVDDVISFLEYRIPMNQGIPYDGIEQIKNHIHLLNDYERVVDSILLLDENKSHFVQHSIDILMYSFADIDNSLSDKLFSEDYIFNKLNIGNFRAAAYMLKYVPFKEETVDTFLYTSNKAASLSDIQIMTNIFYHLASTERGGRVSTIGSAPPIFIMKRSLFQKIYDELRPGKLRAIITECIKIMDNRINQSLKDDEELFNEKRY